MLALAAWPAASFFHVEQAWPAFAATALVQALGLSFTVSTFVLAFDLGGQGALDGAMLLGSGAAVVPALVGMRLGAWLRGRISQTLFRRFFYAGMLMLGATLAL